MEITTKFINNAQKKSKTLGKWSNLNKEEAALFKNEMSPLRSDWDEEASPSTNKSLQSKMKKVGSRLQLVAGKRQNSQDQSETDLESP